MVQFFTHAKPQSRKEKTMPENEIAKIVLVEDKVIVEFKTVEKIVPVHKKQLLTYLRLTDKRLGLR